MLKKILGRYAQFKKDSTTLKLKVKKGKYYFSVKKAGFWKII